MARSSLRRGRRVAVAVMMGLGAASGGIVLALSGPAGTAFADTTPPYEEFCPGTPVGDIAINGAVTTGTITPASPASGATFNVTNYQTTLTIPSAISQASAALGNSALAGTAQTTVDATGATPASIPSAPITFTNSLASPLPANGITLDLPATPATIGPFTASGGAISITQGSQASLTVTVSGSAIALKCTAYPNNSVASGIVTAAPTAAPISPVIATTSATGATSTPTTAAPSGGTTTPTTAPPTSPSTGTATTTPAATPAATAMTGPGPDLWLLAAAGAALLCLGFASLAFGEGPRLLRRLRSPGVDATTGDGGGGGRLWIDGST
ncbi:MAG TPA: hypothetical protein VED63_13115, partial [Acidimicrobiales bacterium]|nr:hypothetical protein [Acidimicrobiales bacterium]